MISLLFRAIFYIGWYRPQKLSQSFANLLYVNSRNLSYFTSAQFYYCTNVSLWYHKNMRKILSEIKKDPHWMQMCEELSVIYYSSQIFSQSSGSGFQHSSFF